MSLVCFNDTVQFPTDSTLLGCIYHYAESYLNVGDGKTYFRHGNFKQYPYSY